MFLKRADSLLKVVFSLVCFHQYNGRANDDSNVRNIITLTNPEKHAVWVIGQNSNSISWSQSKFCFKWNIELLDNQHNKVLDISIGLSEFKEGVMRHHWMVPMTVQSGDYRIRICESNSADSCGVSETLFIKNKKVFATNEEQDSEVFSPLQRASTAFAVSNSSNTDKHGLWPHERRRKDRLDKRRRFLQHITEQIGIRRSHAHSCSLERVHKPSKEAFLEHYMKLRKPVILTGMMEDWNALASWNFEYLGSQLTEGVQVEVNINEGLSPYFRWNDYRIEFAGGDREPAKVVMKDFHRVYPELVKDVNFPEFSEDFMELVDEDIRPPQMSLEMAPRRSGFNWRVESLNASVWSAMIVGRKRWGFYQPTQYFVPGILHNNYRKQDHRPFESYVWWTFTRPHLDADHIPLECVQEPGEILFVPSGWWWSTMNLDDTIAVQKSTCDISSIRACRDELRELADSSGDSYHGDIFIQLRHHMVNNNPGLVTDEDREFRSPIRDLGRTKAEHDKYLYEETWKKYFGEEMEPTNYNDS